MRLLFTQKKLYFTGINKILDWPRVSGLVVTFALIDSYFLALHMLNQLIHVQVHKPYRMLILHIHVINTDQHERQLPVYKFSLLKRNFVCFNLTQFKYSYFAAWIKITVKLSSRDTLMWKHPVIRGQFFWERCPIFHMLKYLWQRDTCNVGTLPKWYWGSPEDRFHCPTMVYIHWPISSHVGKYHFWYKYCRNTGIKPSSCQCCA